MLKFFLAIQKKICHRKLFVWYHRYQNKSFLGEWFIVFSQLYYTISSEELFRFQKQKMPYLCGLWRFANVYSCYGREVRNTFYDSTDRYPLDVQIFSNAGQSNKIHNTQKPVEVYRYFMRTYINECETVLDFSAGSMTCAIAGIEENRKVICIEKDKEIFELGRNRVMKYLQERNRSV